MSIIDKFIAIALEQVKNKCGYVLGADGRVLTPELLSIWGKNYSVNERDNMIKTAQKWMGKVCWDCSGLVLGTLLKLGLIAKGFDTTAHGIFKNICVEVKKENLKPGDLVFVADSTGYIGHVGIYIGNNRVLQARGTYYGCVETPLFPSFNRFGRLKVLEENIDMKYDEIIKKYTSDPDGWLKSISAIKEFKGNLGDLNIFKFVPELIEKIYNSKG